MLVRLAKKTPRNARGLILRSLSGAFDINPLKRARNGLLAKQVKNKLKAFSKKLVKVSKFAQKNGY